MYVEHDYLQPTRHISVEQQLAIFLKIVGENASNRMVQDRFQRRMITVSTSARSMLSLQDARRSGARKVVCDSVVCEVCYDVGVNGGSS